jgi:hypothetical protein
MPKLSKEHADILKSFGEDAKLALWDCHGTWVIYHKALERIATTAGITFPIAKTRVLEADAKTKIVSMIVVGEMGEREEWATGEASPGNNKNAYPYAMAEKRGKDRVILKLIGLSGEVYEEAKPEFKDREPVSPREGAGTAPDTPTSYELFDEFGNVEDVFPTAEGFILALSTVVKDHAKWWTPENRKMVTVIGQEAEKGSDLKKHARLLYKLGEECAGNVNVT